MHIACACDARFAPDCAVMLASLMRTNRPEAVTVHLLRDESLTDCDVGRLRGIVVAAGGSFDAVPMSGDGVCRLAESDRFPIRAWYRVLLPELLPDLSRILYIDADSLVTASLDPLWETDLDRCLLGAVTNPLLADMVPRVQSELGLLDGASYFNSGVLLIDLEAWRAAGTSRAVVDFARRHPALIWPDQDALNGVLHGRRLRLHPRWNALPGIWHVPQRYLPFSPAEVREATTRPAIVHFVGPHKPWHYRCRHPYRRQWFGYLEQTPWRGRAIEGRSVWQAMLRPLPWLWAYRIEIAGVRTRERVGSACTRLGVAAR